VVCPESEVQMELAEAVVPRATEGRRASLVHVATLGREDRQVLWDWWDCLDSQVARAPLESPEHVEVLERRGLQVSREIQDSPAELALWELLVQQVQKETLAYKALLDKQEYKVVHHVFGAFKNLKSLLCLKAVDMYFDFWHHIVTFHL